MGQIVLPKQVALFQHSKYCILHTIWFDSLGVFAPSSNIRIQIARPIIFVGNFRWWSRWHIYLLVYNFFRFHHNRFRDTTSWECIIEDDGVRSCLVELQSFPKSKLYIDPVHRILVQMWFGEIKLLRIFVILMHGIQGYEEYRLCFPSRIWSVNWLHIRCDKCTRRNCLELIHCPAMKDQWDCVLNDLEELGDKEFLVLMDQNNIEIFSCCLRILPSCSSTYHQTNV